MSSWGSAALKARERIRVVAPLGIRFWDPALNVPVVEGLEVEAFPERRPEQRCPAYLTTSGIFAFRGLPGLRSAEYPEDGEAVPSPPVSRRFLVEVRDRRNRFLPTLFGVDAPFAGVFPNAVPASSPAQRPPGFYLFSGADRAALSTLAVIRAQLADSVTGEAARHAVLEVHHDGQLLQVGLADERGAVAVFMPYPAFADPSLAATHGSPAAEAFEQSWDLRFRVRYQPATLAWPAGPIPELRSLFAQAPATFLMGSGPPPVPELGAELVFGRELILRTGADSRLFLGPPPTSP